MRSRDRLPEAAAAPRHMAAPRGLWDRLRRTTAHPLVVVAVVVVALAILAGLTLVGSAGDQEQGAAPPAMSSRPTSVGPEALTTITATPPDTEAKSAVLAATAARGLTIQIVPPVRDFRVKVGDQIRASDAEGRITDPGATGAVQLAVVGIDAEPALLEASFVGWSDGGAAPERRVDTTNTHAIQLGLQVSHRVTVLVGNDRSLVQTTAPVRFESRIGRVDLVPGQPTWVPSVRAERQPGNFEARPVDYRLAIDPSQTFEPTPEALWSVQVGPSEATNAPSATIAGT